VLALHSDSHIEGSIKISFGLGWLCKNIGRSVAGIAFRHIYCVCVLMLCFVFASSVGGHVVQGKPHFLSFVLCNVV
jgi:hypothetical protein